MEFGSLANKKKKAKGILPCRRWLEKNEYKGLRGCMRLYPEKFAHIEKNIKSRTRPFKLDECISIAEDLEKEHGKMPYDEWLNQNGYRSIVRHKKLMPEKFKHIRQDIPRIRGEGRWVKIAETLERKYEKLPSCKWLRENGYGGLYKYLYKYPEKFAHIDQERKRKSTEELIYDIAKVSDGKKLPSYTWLKKNGYKHVLYALRNHPELFEGIEREYGKTKGKCIEEWVKVAIRLSKENNKILPKDQWLKENGYDGLCKFINSHSSRFKGMKQEYYNGFRIIGEE